MIHSPLLNPDEDLVAPINRAMTGVMDLRKTKEIVDLYSDPARHYHALRHISYLFSAVETVLGRDGLSPTQKVAILFHDAILVPGENGKNEERSAALIAKYAASFHPDVAVSDAQTIVRDTAKHVATIEQSKVVLDLDLVGLAKPLPDYLSDSEDVWQEAKPSMLKKFGSGSFARAAFDRGSVAYLTNLASKQVFCSAPFAQFEPAAQSNISHSAALLSALSSVNRIISVSNPKLQSMAATVMHLVNQKPSKPISIPTP